MPVLALFVLVVGISPWRGDDMCHADIDCHAAVLHCPYDWWEYTIKKLPFDSVCSELRHFPINTMNALQLPSVTGRGSVDGAYPAKIITWAQSERHPKPPRHRLCQATVEGVMTGNVLLA